MNPVQDMFQHHPKEPRLDAEALAALVRSTADCAAVCTSCADACLAEPHVEQLVRCIRLNLDCADACAATGRVAVRLVEGDDAFFRAQLEACGLACRACGDECEKHADRHAHCRVCAERCRRCEDDCAQILAMIGAR